MFVIRLQEGPLKVADVGGKAASLAYLLQHEITVPPGFVLTTRAHEEYLRSQKPAASPTIPPSIQEAVAVHLGAFDPATRFAVRSSAVFEDMADASFAGQYDTLLDITAEEVYSAIVHCWQSASNAHARSYAAQHGLAIDQGRMGVIVQALVPAEKSGVSFSLHPVTGADQVVINATYGLGEAVVSGIVTPDTFVVDKDTEHVEALLGDKECLVRPTHSGGTEVVDTPLPLRQAFALNADEISAVHRMTVALERIAGFAVDVEWAIASQVLYCLQMRPVVVPNARTGVSPA
jgi:phosphoenolpyruvate synthase/pyruvate phosphate dikinase